MVSFILVFYFYLKYRKFKKLKKNVINYDVIVEITSCVPQTSSLLLSHEYLSMFHALDVLLEVPQKQTNFMFFSSISHSDCKHAGFILDAYTITLCTKNLNVCFQQVSHMPPDQS